jgi:hypothetical protein
MGSFLSVTNGNEQPASFTVMLYDGAGKRGPQGHAANQTGRVSFCNELVHRHRHGRR